jgi:hypothetical protein
MLHFILFFFACPKKNQKKTPENDIQHVFGLRPDKALVLSFLRQLDPDA